MRQIYHFVLFCIILLPVPVFGEVFRIKNQSILDAMDRSKQFNQASMGITDYNVLYPGDTLGYVRTDGIIMLVRVLPGGDAWHIFESFVTEDSLRYYGAYNYESTYILSQNISRMAWMVEDIYTFAKICGEMGDMSVEMDKPAIKFYRNHFWWDGFFTGTSVSLIVVVLLFIFRKKFV